MKKVILASLLAAAAMNATAQVITDTVSVDANYVNQVWYSMANNEQGSSAKNNWDLAFDASGFGSSVMINSVNTITLWKYPNADTSGWATVDTAGLSTWATRWNSDTSWAYGAMGNYADPTNPYDLDWGQYNITTHIVTGDSIYIIKLADGSYRKLVIQSLASSAYTFKYAKLDGSDLHTATVDKSLYTGKNFGYYSLQNNAALDREPVAANWDLVFTQYTAFIPTAYTVTGVLSNAGVEVAKLANLTDLATNTSYATATFQTAINTIGYNWKSFNGASYSTQDSLLYFVKPANGDIWKVIFKGFGGSSTGNYIFTKEKLYTAPTAGIAATTAAAASVALYPNPAIGQAVNVIYSFGAPVTAATITVYDITGKAILTSALDAQPGLHQYTIPAHALRSGMYIVDVRSASGSKQQQLIIQ